MCHKVEDKHIRNVRFVLPTHDSASETSVSNLNDLLFILDSCVDCKKLVIKSNENPIKTNSQIIYKKKRNSVLLETKLISLTFILYFSIATNADTKLIFFNCQSPQCFT